MGRICVIGGGAAGMMAAYSAAQKGHSVLLVEKNEKLGKKIYITGKGRCNLTNACDTEDFFDYVMTNPKFLYSAIYSFTNRDVMEFFEKNGMKIKTERGNRVFPASDKASDVIRTLDKLLCGLKVEVLLNTCAVRLHIEENRVSGVWVKDGKGERFEKADAVVVATGGLSYSSTGSDGDGLRFAKESGHKLISCIPSLVALETKETFVKEMMGLSLKNVEVTMYQGTKELFFERGEMLFTHFGVSGPLILSASTKLPKLIRKAEAKEGAGNGRLKDITISIDLKPALSKEQLEERILRDFSKAQNKAVKNVLGGMLPSVMIPVFLRLCGMDGELKVNSVTKEERRKMVDVMKGIVLSITGTRDFDEAVITSGGVAVSQINPSTMESKLIKKLFFAGELIDVDAVTGGFNLQIAWSTGFLAGMSV